MVKLLSTVEAAHLLGVSPATLETWRCRGGGPPFVKVGSRVLYEPEALASYIARNRRLSTAHRPEDRASYPRRDLAGTRRGR